MSKFWPLGSAAFTAVLVAGSCVAADPGIDAATQHDVIAWHLSQGESRADVCAIAEQYFEVRCVMDGDDFVLTRGWGTEITYLATIRLDPEK